MKAKKSKSVESGLTASKFMALSDAEKNRIYEEIDSKSTDELLRESKPLNARQKSRWRKMKQVLDDQNNGSAPNSDYSPQSFTEVHRVFVGRSLHQKAAGGNGHCVILLLNSIRRFRSMSRVFLCVTPRTSVVNEFFGLRLRKKLWPSQWMKICFGKPIALRKNRGWTDRSCFQTDFDL